MEKIGLTENSCYGKNWPNGKFGTTHVKCETRVNGSEFQHGGKEGEIIVGRAQRFLER